jgi:hypothetical protein
VTRILRTLCFAALFAPAACAQFSLFLVNESSERPVASVLDLGTVGRNDPLTSRFRLRNSSPAPAALRLLEVGGTGFSLSTSLTLPQTVASGAAIDFSVIFRAPGDGTYSAALRSEGISVLLTATVAAQLTIALVTPTGPVALTAGSAVSFGVVEQGSSASVRFLIQNQTGREQVVSGFIVQGDDFYLSAAPPPGLLLRPLEETPFEIAFTPSAAGARSATFVAGVRSFLLNGTGLEPPLPKPQLSISLAQHQSRQQGTITVMLSEKSRTAGTGTLTLEFQPQISGAVDSTIQFAQGSQGVAFTVRPGDDRVYFGDQASAAFQTGTAAGNLSFTVKLGNAVDRQDVEIAAAPVVIDRVETLRTPTGLEVRIIGFDNVRSAGPLSFTFYDRAGVAIPPGAIRADGSADFGKYFQQSDSGGSFLLKAAFPVSGDVSLVDSVEVELTNSQGSTRSFRAKF